MTIRLWIREQRPSTLAARVRVLVLGAIGLLGCAPRPGNVPEGVQISAPVYQFPQRDAVERLMRTTVQIPNAPVPALIEEWTLASHPKTSPSANPFVQALLEGESQLSQAGSLDCAAYEWARIYKQYQSAPDDRTRAYVVARCGGVNPNVQALFVAGQADPRRTDSNLLAEVRPSLADGLGKINAGKSDVGFALLREGADFVVALLLAPHKVTLASTPRLLGAERYVTVRGRLEQNSPAVMALANQGAYDAAPCEADPRVRLPEFRFRCPIRAEDDRVWIDLLSLRDNDLLLTPVGMLLMVRDERASLTYRAPTSNAPAATVPTEQGLLEALNAVRARAGRPPLSLAARQCQQNKLLAPHFFAGLYREDTELSSQAALSMLAGFEVAEMIKDGQFLGIHGQSLHDAWSWVAMATERPLGRFVLLNPRTQAVAFGVVPSNRVSGLAVALTTYEFFDPRADATAPNQVLEAFNAQRQAAGAAPATLWTQNDQAQAEVSKIAGQAGNEQQAVQSALASFTHSTGRNAAAFVVPTSDLKSLVFPPELLTGSAPVVGIGVTRRREAGAAWGQYLVLFILGPGAQPHEMARAASPPQLLRTGSGTL